MDNPRLIHKPKSNHIHSQSSFQEALDPKLRYHIVYKQQMQL